MKTIAWFVLGVAAGFVLAHLIDHDPRGHRMLAAVDARLTAFTDRTAAMYRTAAAGGTGH